MAIVNLDKVHAGYKGNLEHVRFATDVTNGVFFVDGGLVAGERELIEGVAPTDVTKQEVLLHATAEVMYDPRQSGLKHFVLKAGKAGRGYHLTEGDIITLTVDLFESKPTVDEFAVPVNGSMKLAPASDLTGGTRLAFSVIEKTVLGYDADEAYALKVIKN